MGALSRLAHRLPLGLSLFGLGLVTGLSGTVLAVANVANVVAASTVSACGTSAALMPGSSGSCQETFASPYGTQPVGVTLAISTVSRSGGGQPPGRVGTEALLDGLATGLQVQIIDDATGKLFLVASVHCFQAPGSPLPAVYPTAAYCTSDQRALPVISYKSSGNHTQTFTVRWLLPLIAGNPYQGGVASVTLQPTFTDLASGIPGGGVVGQRTTAPSPSPSGAVLGQHTTTPPRPPSGGVLGARTPGTGAGLLVGLSRGLIVVGITLLLAGLWVWRRARYPRSEEGGS